MTEEAQNEPLQIIKLDPDQGKFFQTSYPKFFAETAINRDRWENIIAEAQTIVDEGDIPIADYYAEEHEKQKRFLKKRNGCIMFFIFSMLFVIITFLFLFQGTIVLIVGLLLRAIADSPKYKVLTLYSYYVMGTGGALAVVGTLSFCVIIIPFTLLIFMAMEEPLSSKKLNERIEKLKVLVFETNHHFLQDTVYKMKLVIEYIRFRQNNTQRTLPIPTICIYHHSSLELIRSKPVVVYDKELVV